MWNKLSVPICFTFTMFSFLLLLHCFDLVNSSSNCCQISKLAALAGIHHPPDSAVLVCIPTVEDHKARFQMLVVYSEHDSQTHQSGNGEVKEEKKSANKGRVIEKITHMDKLEFLMGDPRNHYRTSTAVLFCLSVTGASLRSHHSFVFRVLPGGFQSSVLFAYGA